MTGKFQLWETKHETLVGFDFTQSHTMYHTQGDWPNPPPDLAIDIYNPRASYGINPSLMTTALSTRQSGQAFGMTGRILVFLSAQLACLGEYCFLFTEGQYVFVVDLIVNVFNSDSNS